MIYEIAYVLRTEADEQTQKSLAQVIKDTISSFKGEVLLEDSWGVKTFAQPTTNGVTKGTYLYMMYKAEIGCNTEIERRLRISEDVL